MFPRLHIVDGVAQQAAQEYQSDATLNANIARFAEATGAVSISTMHVKRKILYEIAR